MSAASRLYMIRVKHHGCLICRIMGLPSNGLSDAHHVFDTAHRSDWLVVPLCREHHQGKTGFHGLGERAFNMRYRTDEKHLLAETIRLLETA